MDLGLSGRRAAVAGASGGLGLATARALAEAGAAVAVCGRDRARIDAAAASIGAAALVADVSSAAGGTAFVEAAQEVLGGVDVLVANAGGPRPGCFADTPSGAYGEALELSLLSVVGMCESAVPAMRAAGWGRVIAITSISVRQPLPGMILSNTARAGVTGFLKTLAREVAADGVTVNSLQPGLHDTPRVREVYGDRLDDEIAGVPAARIGRPEDFGRVAAFLCSDPARYVTGSAIAVDGGAYAGLL